MNHNNSKYVNPSNNKNTTHKLKLYPNTNKRKKKKKKSHINTKRETKQKAKSYYIILLYIIKIELRCCGCATWLHQITEILLNF